MNIFIILICISIIMVNISIIKLNKGLLNLEERLLDLENNTYIKWAKQNERRFEEITKENLKKCH